jgi:hypothetical protein
VVDHVAGGAEDVGVVIALGQHQGDGGVGGDGGAA